MKILNSLKDYASNLNLRVDFRNKSIDLEGLINHISLQYVDQKEIKLNTNFVFKSKNLNQIKDNNE